MISFDADGDQFVFSSQQGRYDDVAQDAYSHVDGIRGFAHSFDWGGAIATGNPIYVVAPTDGYIIYAEDEYTVGHGQNANSGLGNAVTMRASQTDGDGNPIYLTFAHLENGSVPNELVTDPVSNPATNTEKFVQAGEIIGVVGLTGRVEGIHAHMQVSNAVDKTGSQVWYANASELDNPDGPPVYMLFPEGVEISERHELSSVVTEDMDLEQDYGFPIGEGAYPYVASNISSTFTNEEFIALNHDVESEYQGLQDADWFVFT